MLIFLAFSLLTEIWICTHYISHFASLLSSEDWWLLLGAGWSNRRRRLHCHCNQCLEWFLSEKHMSKTQGSKGGLGKVRRGSAPHFPWQRAVQDRNRNPSFPCATHMASSEHCNPGTIITVCPASLYCVTCFQMKCHPGPAQFGNAKKCSIFIVQAASTNYIFISYSAHLITMKKSFLTKTHCKCWTQLHDHPAPLCIHCPSSPLWCRLVQTSSHWETPVLKAAVWDMGVGACGKFPWAPEELLPSHGSSLAECRS